MVYDFFDIGEGKSYLLGDVYVKSYIFDTSKALIFSFAGAGHSVTRGDIEKGVSPWGYEYLKKKGVNVISFSNIAGSYNYYRDNTFIRSLADFSKALPTFKERLAYGGSMGGYAASAFANVLGVERVLLLNPISTRKKNIAVWDYEAKRAFSSFGFDWKGRYADGAEAVATGYVVYDPLFDLDKKHAERYLNLVKLHVPGVGHSIATHLHEMNVLNWLVESFINNNLDVGAFYSLVRRRRNIKRYYDWMLSEENKYLTPLRSEVIMYYKKMLFIDEKIKRRLTDNDVKMALFLANALRATDINGAIKILKVAHSSRPDMSVLRKRIFEYREQVL